MLYTSILWISCLIITPSCLKSEAQDFLRVTSSTQEGFIADTIIKTIDGYKTIESLEINDQLMRYDTDTQQYYPCRITAITKQCAPNWVKITTDNCVIQTGIYQKFYIAEKNDLIFAKDIKPGDCLYGGSGNNILIINVENVDTSTTLYAITVEQNHFCITHSDVLVHNFDPATASTILILAPAVNPVGVTILGGAILAGAFGLALHKIWKNEKNDHYFTNGLTNKEARKKAGEWGYTEDQDPPFNPHGKPAFRKGQTWITPDADGHNGGVWKEFDKKGNRKGTLDENGNKIKD
jgi:hypothetical protein